MLKARMVSRCAYTNGSRGVIHMAHDVLKMVAGAVDDPIEWLILLKGSRSADGREVRISGFEVPRQYRTVGRCGLVDELDLDPTKIVGVLHSHHTMGAFFSQTDDTELNPRFPCSIVVSSKLQTGEHRLLGFAYQATGKVVLPCGERSGIAYQLVPDPPTELLPTATPTWVYGDELYACPHTTRRRVGKQDEVKAKCGITTKEDVRYAFGRDGRELMRLVQEQTVSEPKWSGKGHGKQHKSRWVHDEPHDPDLRDEVDDPLWYKEYWDKHKG